MFKRYAIFYTPEGVFAEWGARWLGWNSQTGAVVRHPDIAGLDVPALTDTPRKYGLHGTLKAPFALAAGTNQLRIEQAAAEFAQNHSGIDAGPLALCYKNGFVALRPSLDPPVLQEFAGQVVRAFDHLRAPLTADDLIRRRKARLSSRQDQQLMTWGYPFVFDDFQFHLTLTGRVNKQLAAQVIEALEPQIGPLLPARFVINAITLMGEDADGMFHQINRYPITG